MMDFDSQRKTVSTPFLERAQRKTSEGAASLQRGLQPKVVLTNIHALSNLTVLHYILQLPQLVFLLAQSLRVIGAIAMATGH